MKKGMLIVIAALTLIVCSAAAPIVAQEETPTLGELSEEYPLIFDLLEQAIVVLGNASIPVFIGNLIKSVPGAKKLDGKIGGIVNWLIILTFLFFFGVGTFYDPDVIANLLPGITDTTKQILALLTGMIEIVMVMKLAPKTYTWVRGTPVVGKSFSFNRGE